MKKHILIFVIFLSVMIGVTVVLPVSTDAQEVDLSSVSQDYYSNGYQYTVLSDGTARILDYLGSGGSKVVVPSFLDKYKVTSIGSRSFYYYLGITDVTIPDTVTEICDYAFYRCSNITNLSLSKNLTNIGRYAFSECSNLSSLSIPDSVVSVGDGSFYKCSNLSSVTIGKNVKTIGNSAFRGLSLTSVTIPVGVTDIYNGAFGDCLKLKRVYINGYSVNIGNAAFGYYYDDKTQKTVKIDDVMFFGYGGSSAEGYAKSYGFGFTCTGPSAPVVNSLSNVSNGVSVSWGKVSGVEKYRVLYKTQDSDWFVSGDTASTTFTVTGLQSGTLYAFAVRCINAAATEYTSNYSTPLKSILYISQPAISSVSNVSNGVSVKWGSVTGAAKYRVFYKTSSTGWTKSGDTTSTSYTVKGLKSGTTYTFTVRCLNSNATAFTSSYDGAGKSITYISQPAISSVSNVSNGVSVKWGSVTGAAKYRVFYKTSSTGWTKSGDTTSTSYTVKGLKSGTTYTFTVRCLNSNATAFTSSYDGTGKSITYLSVPTLVGATASGSKIVVKWKSVTGASGYYVYRKTSGGSWSKIGTTKSASSVTFNDTTAKSGTKYTYTVRAYRGSILSSFNATGVSGKR